MTKEEELICNKVIDMLSDFGRDKFGIEQRSNDYLSLIYCDNDFFRVKFTDNTSWISIRLAKQDRREDDERFSAQKKKSQLHWKADIYSVNDINLFECELIGACVSYSADTYTPRHNNHSKIVLSEEEILKKLYEKRFI